MKKYIYLVLGGNGALLHTRYDRAVFCRDHYLCPPRELHKCASVEQAQERAIDHLWLIAPVGLQIPEHLELDKLYYTCGLPCDCCEWRNCYDVHQF